MLFTASQGLYHWLPFSLLVGCCGKTIFRVNNNFSCLICLFIYCCPDMFYWLTQVIVSPVNVSQYLQCCYHSGPPESGQIGKSFLVPSHWGGPQNNHIRPNINNNNHILFPNQILTITYLNNKNKYFMYSCWSNCSSLHKYISIENAFFFPCMERRKSATWAVVTMTWENDWS